MVSHSFTYQKEKITVDRGRKKKKGPRERERGVEEIEETLRCRKQKEIARADCSEKEK